MRSETQDGGSKGWRKTEEMQLGYGVGGGEPQGRRQNRFGQYHRNNLRNRDRLVRLQRRPRVTAMILLMTAGVRCVVRRCLRKTEATAKPAHPEYKRKHYWHHAPHLFRRYHGSSDTVRDIPVTHRSCSFTAVGADGK